MHCSYRWLGFVATALTLFDHVGARLLNAQGVNVSVGVLVRENSSSKGGTRHSTEGSPANVVVWLTPASAQTLRAADGLRNSDAQHAGPFRMLQKEKQFTPHMLVVPTGSSVEFPNRDPFFHNVFSLFNGKRFDLGMYESGTTRFVRFDREGVSYIFCNIHPEMGAVVLALSTPYYGVSGADGAVVLHAVPPGSYRLNVWSETAQPADAELAQRMVTVGGEPIRLGAIVLQTTANPMRGHRNKFGEEYRPEHGSPY